MEKINKWAAEQCGVEFKQTWKGQVWHLNGKLYETVEWKIKDPRCREIVREHFKLATDQYGKGWASFPRSNVDLAIETRGNGKTIREAEIACITAIWEAQHETD